MSIFDHKNVEVTPEVIADTFISEFIVNNDLSPKKISEINSENQDQYMFKCMVYRIALVLIILINEEKNNPKVLLVREVLESKVFGIRNDQSENLLSQIQMSMSELKDLLFSKGNKHELSWARYWFESCDIEIINPVDLTLFAVYWMDMYIALNKTLREFKIT